MVSVSKSLRNNSGNLLVGLLLVVLVVVVYYCTTSSTEGYRTWVRNNKKMESVSRPIKVRKGRTGEAGGGKGRGTYKEKLASLASTKSMSGQSGPGHGNGIKLLARPSFQHGKPQGPIGDNRMDSPFTPQQTKWLQARCCRN